MGAYDSRPHEGHTRVSAHDHEAKAVIRERMKQSLRSVERERRARAGVAVASTVGDLLPNPDAGGLMGYLPMWEEFDCEPVMQAWLDRGGVLATPVVNWAAATMEPGRLGGLEPPHIRMGLRGVREPVGNAIVPIDAIAAMLVPGLAFDAAGRRLGRGGGFYDKFLGALPPQVLRVGVCFDEQIIEGVPVEGHDRRVHLIVTPTTIHDAR